jgi:arsenate reductase
MITLYHNNRCSKSRNALQYLNDKGIQFDLIPYLEKGVSIEELNSILGILQIPAEALLRKGEPEYQSFIKGKDLSEEELVALMSAYPKLIERPIVINGNQGVIARPAELIDNIL